MPDDPSTQEPQVGESTSGGGPAELREAAERGRQALARNEELARENLMLRAGIPETALGRQFVATLAPETTPDAAKAAWQAELKALGVPDAPSAPPAPAPAVGEAQGGSTATPEEQALHAQRDQLGAGGSTPPPGGPTPHPATVGLEHFTEALRDGSTAEDAASHFLDNVIGAAIKGDDRVIWTPEKQVERFAASEGR